METGVASAVRAPAAHRHAARHRPSTRPASAAACRLTSQTARAPTCSRMTELDALVFGHVTWVLQAPLPNSRLRQLLVTRPNLVAFSVRVGSTFFGEKP